MSYLVVDGFEIDPKRVTELREKVIKLRDDLLGAGRLDWAFVLSINIAVLEDYKERLEKEAPFIGEN